VAQRETVHPGIETMGRVGYATKGLVYVLIGVLTAAVAIRARGDAPDTESALVAVVTQPFGTLLIALMGVGLAAYAAWRIMQCFVDAEGKGSDAKGWAIRLGFAFSGLIHAGLAWTALKLAIGIPRDSVDVRKDWTATVLAWPLGPWLVAAVGVGVIGYGMFQFYKVYSRKFEHCMKTHEMDDHEEKIACRSAQFGLAARGVVFCIVGSFFLSAAWKHNANEVGGLKEALHTLENQPFGPALLGVVALGLAAYGVYMMFESRFHVIHTH